ncbi:MAG TPA: hypothetical protein VMR76_02095 [Candidatus Saccharimonadia bacterium]|nr:hypothetical protein [Candidatus Saccharimonadia bacterium]
MSTSPSLRNLSPEILQATVDVANNDAMKGNAHQMPMWYLRDHYPNILQFIHDMPIRPDDSFHDRLLYLEGAFTVAAAICRAIEISEQPVPET